MLLRVLLGAASCFVVVQAQDPSCANGCAVGPVKAVGKDSGNMNGDYTVAGNPTGFSTKSSDYDPGHIEYFDVYSPLVKTRYSQVYWTMMPSVPLPDEVVQRFAGKTMVVTGWESDQVIKGSGGEPDQSVPITWAYNHHYGAYLNGKDSVLEEVTLQGHDDPNGWMGHAHPGDKVWTTRARDDDRNATSRIPVATVFATGNGGEYRKSFHSYPTGYGQLIESPVSWAIQPMQIDTKNRDGSMDKPGMPFTPGPYPAVIAQNTRAPRAGPDAVYSGLLECPCTDRITKVMATTGAASAAVSGTCGHELGTASECESAASEMAQSAPATHAAPPCSFGEHQGVFLAGDAPGAPANFSSLAIAQAWCCAHKGCGGITFQQGAYTARASGTPTKYPMKGLVSWILGGSTNNFNFSSGSSPSKPTGCSIDVTSTGVTGFFNTLKTGVACGGQPGERALAGSASVGEVSIHLNMDEHANVVTIELSGPDRVWFGSGFGANEMSGTYSIVVDGQGKVSEHKLGDHAPGTVLQPSVKVLSSKVANGVRTVTLTRQIKMADYAGNYYDFDLTVTSLPVISAVGSGPTFSYHKSHSTATVALFAESAPTCVCAGTPPAFGKTPNAKLVYDASGTTGSYNGSVGFGKNCVGECAAGDTSCTKESSLIAQKNPTCDIRYYKGGLGCCHHLYYLLDKNQSHLIPDDVLQYHMKMRFYFQEFNPQRHQQLYRWHWQTAMGAGEYDVPIAPKGTPPANATHTITAKIQVKDFATGACDYRSGINALTPECKQGSVGFKPIFLGGHCHAPTCLSMELFNADTGELLCRNVPTYGTLKEGANGTADPNRRFEEDGYLALPPCVWSEDPASGLPQAPLLTWDTNLSAVKVCNNTYGHTGEMARWQGHGIIV